VPTRGSDGLRKEHHVAGERAEETVDCSPRSIDGVPSSGSSPLSVALWNPAP
jgi:hypothetical protein